MFSSSRLVPPIKLTGSSGYMPPTVDLNVSIDNLCHGGHSMSISFDSKAMWSMVETGASPYMVSKLWPIGLQSSNVLQFAFCPYQCSSVSNADHNWYTSRQVDFVASNKRRVAGSPVTGEPSQRDHFFYFKWLNCTLSLRR
jgi:hypothetical protein